MTLPKKSITQKEMFSYQVKPLLEPQDELVLGDLHAAGFTAAATKQVVATTTQTP